MGPSNDYTTWHPRRNVADIIVRLEAWFQVKEGAPFFKFYAPCDHKMYREGDSWIEELDLERRTFQRHFAAVGTHYGTRSAFENAEDPFQGKLYASYYEKVSHMTWYVRNDALDATIKMLYRRCVVRAVSQRSVPTNDAEPFTDPVTMPVRGTEIVQSIQTSFFTSNPLSSSQLCKRLLIFIGL